jgi:lysophospholipase L1-like esterase
MNRPWARCLALLSVAGCSHGPGAGEAAPSPAVEAASGLADGQAGDHDADAAPDAATTEVAEAGPVGTRPEEREPKRYKVVVHTGDSMVGGGLCKALAPRFKAEGTKFVRDVWESASIVAFADSDRLKKLMKKYDPDLVLLTLGANDVFDKHPEYMIRYIDAIVKTVGERDCYWIGPPLWKGDAGLNAVIRDHAAPCVFYDSSHLTLQRAGDGIHPTDKGGAVWADAFWEAFRGVRVADPPSHEAAQALVGVRE